ncbi:MAG: hypothetical protein QM496_01915 [Verrucomicrobiota bacterium]
MAVKELHFETGEFNRSVERFMKYSKKSLEEVMKAQAKSIVKTLISVTPPGSEGVSGQAAKKQGEAAVERDIRRVLAPASAKFARKGVDLKQVHQKRRNFRGRVNKRGVVHLVPKGEFTRYLRERKKKVGFLAGGFNTAAAKLGYKPPAWIWRHSSPGAVKIRVSGRGINVLITNKVKFAGNVKGIERRMDFAMKTQSERMHSQVDYFLENAARKAGFKSRR